MYDIYIHRSISNCNGMPLLAYLDTLINSMYIKYSYKDCKRNWQCFS